MTMDPSRDDEIRRLLVGEQMALDEAADVLGTTAYHLQRAIDRIEFAEGKRMQRPKCGTQRGWDPGAWRVLNEQGLTQAEIARRIGRSEAVVSRAFKRLRRSAETDKVPMGIAASTPISGLQPMAEQDRSATWITLVRFGDGRHAIYRDDGLFHEGDPAEVERRAEDLANRPGHGLRRLEIRPGWLRQSDPMPTVLSWIPEGTILSTKHSSSGAEIQ